MRWTLASKRNFSTVDNAHSSQQGRAANAHPAPEIHNEGTNGRSFGAGEARWLTGPSAAPFAAAGGLLPLDELASYQWQLQNNGQTGGTAGIDLNLAGVWPDYTGRGQRVGIVDDGFDFTHRDLAGRFDLTRDRDFRDGDAAPAAGPEDSHGTMVAGVVGAAAGNGGMAGVAYGATLLGFRVGFGADGTLAQFTAALAAQKEVDVSNQSWGFARPFSDDFGSSGFAAFEAALAATATTGRQQLGTVLVAAAGNGRAAGDNVNYHNFQNSPYVIAVAALDHDGVIAPFSTPGAAVLVAAPGVAIGTVDGPGDAGAVTGDYAIAHGTSFAAPAVSGVVALMLEANPLLGARDVQEILACSARQVGSGAGWQTNGATSWNGGGRQFSHDYGFGLVDARAAVRLAETWSVRSTFGNVDATTSGVTDRIIAPDGSAVSLMFDVSEGLTIDRVLIELDLDHSFQGDLVVRLTSPQGTTSTLVDRPGVAPGTSGLGSAADGLDFTFSSVAHLGESTLGTWVLSISDEGSGGAGSLGLASASLGFLGDRPSGDDTYVFTDAYADLSADDALRRELADGAGYDTLNAAAVTGDCVVDLGRGIAEIAGGRLALSAGTSIESVFGGDGDDRLTGDRAANRLAGGRGDDVLDGAGGNDTLEGGAGDDIYYVGSSGDRVIEVIGQGTDRIYSSLSRTLEGAVEELWLTGRGRADGIGNALDNRLVGNAAANILVGGDGADYLTGGAGADRFRYTALSHFGAGVGNEQVLDFSSADRDRIDLAGIDANLTRAGNQAFALLRAEGAAFTTAAGELRWGRAGAGAFVQGDVDGDGAPDFALDLVAYAGALTTASFIL